MEGISCNDCGRDELPTTPSLQPPERELTNSVAPSGRVQWGHVPIEALGYSVLPFHGKIALPHDLEPASRTGTPHLTGRSFIFPAPKLLEFEPTERSVIFAVCAQAELAVKKSYEN